MTEPRATAGMRWRGDDPRWDRWAAGTGIIFAGLALFAFLIQPSGPSSADPAEEVLSHFRDNDTSIFWQGAIFGFAATFFLWFFGTLAAAIRRAEGDPAGRIPAIIVAAAGASAGLYLAGVASWVALAKTADEEGTTRALFDLGNAAFGITDFTVAALVLAVSIGVLRTKLLPDWVALIGAIAAVYYVLDGFVQQTSESDFQAALGQISLILFLAWTLLVSLLLMRSPRVVEPMRTTAAPL
jgi:hypothetical protein